MHIGHSRFVDCGEIRLEGRLYSTGMLENRNLIKEPQTDMGCAE